MTIRHLSRKEFFKLLEDHGWSVVDDKYWNDHDMVMIGNKATKESFPIQVRENYYPPIVVEICKQLDIHPPERFEEVAEQMRAIRKKD